MSNRIGRQVLTRILLAASCFALLAAIVDLTSDYQRQLKAIDAQAKQIATELTPPLSQLIWVTNEDLIDTLLNSIISLPEIAGLTLTSDFKFFGLGKDLSAAGCDKVIRHTVPVINTLSDEVLSRESLSLCVDYSGAWQNIQGRLWSALAIGTFKSLLLAAFTLWVLRGLVGRPLAELQQQLKARQFNHTFFQRSADNEIRDLYSVIQSCIRTIDDERRFAETTLLSIAEGVLVVDEHLIIRKANAASQLLLNRGETANSIIERRVDQLSALPMAFCKDIALALIRSDSGQQTYARTQTYTLDNGYTVRANVSRVSTTEGEEKIWVLVFSDLTEAVERQKELAHMADHDALTGLPNRRCFERRLASVVKRAQTRKLSYPLMVIDVDNFKLVNDSYGHTSGDELLRQLTVRLMVEVPEDGLLARIGGDEFALLLPAMDEQAAKIRALGFLKRVAQLPFQLGIHQLSVSVRIGVTNIQADSLDAMQVLSEADTANIIARDDGGGQVVMYAEIMERGAKYRNLLIGQDCVRDALDDGRLILHLQPMMPTRVTLAPVVEVLLRLELANGEMMYPDHFIAAAERFGHIRELDYCVVRETLQAMLKIDPNVRVSVNLSGVTVSDPSAIQRIVNLLTRWRGDLSRLCFEVTETSAVSNLAVASSNLMKLKNLGCSVALDDFGSGLSSLQHLRTLPIDHVKIDGNFIKNIAHSQRDEQVVKAIVKLARSHNLAVVAEYVGCARSAEIITRLGVDYLQGHHFAQAMPIEHWSNIRALFLRQQMELRANKMPNSCWI